MTTEQIRRVQRSLRDSAFICKKCEGEALPCNECLFGLNLLVADEMEKMVPKNPIRTNISSNAFTVWRRYNCPCCEMFLYSGTGTQPTPQKHCHNCGQHIDWSEECG